MWQRTGNYLFVEVSITYVSTPQKLRNLYYLSFHCAQYNAPLRDYNQNTILVNPMSLSYRQSVFISFFLSAILSLLYPIGSCPQLFFMYKLFSFPSWPRFCGYHWFIRLSLSNSKRLYRNHHNNISICLWLSDRYRTMMTKTTKDDREFDKIKE